MKELKGHKMYVLCFNSVKSVDIVSHMHDVFFFQSDIPDMLYACHYSLKMQKCQMCEVCFMLITFLRCV